MIDLGNVHGEHVFYTQNKSLYDLVFSGEIIAIPSQQQGIIYKRPENCTPLELAAKLTADEAKAITVAWNARLEDE